MTSLPRLKNVFHPLPLLLAGGAVGCASAVMFVRLATSGGSSARSTSVHAGSALASSDTASGKQAASLPAAGDFQKMEARGRLACALRLRGISPAQRQAFLQDGLQRSGPERTALLSLLLSEWAESEPSMAAEWILSHLKGAESRKCLDDVLRTWASRDGGAVARWADAEFPKRGHSLTAPAMRALERYAPVWFARMSEMECNKGSVWSNMEFASLRAPGAAKAVSSELQGHVAYTSDPAEMRRALDTDSSGRHVMGKWGWNELFETTAVRWHAEDPAACDQWLATWPENAQAAARHFINQAEAPSKTPPETAQASNAGSTSATSQAQPPPLPDAAAPSAGTVDQQVRAWGQWWHRDAAGAEAFLNTASWPDGLKFTARVQTYAGTP